MHIAHLSVADALGSLRTSENGLASAEAQRRLHEYGANRLAELRGEAQWRLFLRQFTHFFALILWLAAALAFFAEWRSPGAGMWQLGVAIVAVVLINGSFSYWQEYRAERAIAALRELLPQTVKVMRDGLLVTLAAELLVPGDLVLLEEGDNVPADCRLISGDGVRVNAATITGESLPKAHTEFGKIAHLTQTVEKSVSHLQLEIARLSKLVAAFATVLGLVFFTVGALIGLPFWANLMFAIGIIVANVPEGLLPTVTLSLALATQRMAKRNALVRHLPAVETMGCATVILTDKTGTLTQNRKTVRELFVAGWHPNDPRLVIESFEKSILVRMREGGLGAQHVYLLSQGDTAWDELVWAQSEGVPSISYDEELSDAGLDAFAGRLSGLSLDARYLVDLASGDTAAGQALVQRIHDRGLQVFAYTLRPENCFLPLEFRKGLDEGQWGNWEGAFQAIYATGVDAVFADHPDLAVRARP